MTIRQVVGGINMFICAIALISIKLTPVHIPGTDFGTFAEFLAPIVLVLWFLASFSVKASMILGWKIRGMSIISSSLLYVMMILSLLIPPDAFTAANDLPRIFSGMWIITWGVTDVADLTNAFSAGPSSDIGI